jgi:hypothetical protein
MLELKMNILTQVAPLFRVSFVASRSSAGPNCSTVSR